MSSVDTEIEIGIQSLALTVFRSFDDVEGLEEKWDGIVARTGCSIYQTYDWCRVWWQFYGRGRELRLLVFRSGHELVGVVPLFIDNLGVWPFNIRVAKGVGTRYSTSRFAFAVLDEFWLAALELTCTHLFRNDRCHLLTIGPMTQGERIAREVSRIGSSHRLAVAINPAEAAVLMTYDLSNGIEGLLSKTSSGRRANLRRSIRTLEGRTDVVIRRITESAELDSELESFCDLHRQRWAADGQQGHFDDWPDAKSFHRAMIAAQSKHLRCRLYKITCENEVIAYEYGYTFGDWYFWLLPARSTSKEWERMSIGQVSSLIQMRTEAKEGVKHADLGQGFYDYKKSMGADVENLDRVRVSPRGTLNQIRILIWLFIARALQVVYIKLWARRLRPCLRLRPQPFWSFWIRTRL